MIFNGHPMNPFTKNGGKQFQPSRLLAAAVWTINEVKDLGVLATDEGKTYLDSSELKMIDIKYKEHAMVGSGVLFCCASNTYPSSLWNLVKKDEDITESIEPLIRRATFCYFADSEMSFKQHLLNSNLYHSMIFKLHME